MGQGTFKVLGIALVGVFLASLIAGCNGGGTNSGDGSTSGQTQTPSGVLVGDTTLPNSVTTVTNPNPGSFQPRGNIQGIVRDAVTGFPIVGARVIVSIPGTGDTTVTTGASGQYSFANLSASLWNDANADGQVQFAELSAYTLTLDLSAVNAGLPANVEKYPGAAFAEAAVGFANFLDGNNALLGGSTEGGSGASTPVDGLTTSLDFVIGRLTETIRGKVRDAQNGSPLGGATVTLLDFTVPVTATPAAPPAAGTPVAGGIRLSLTNAAVKTGSDGVFVFPGVPAVHAFQVEVEAAGYVHGGTFSAGTGPVTTLGNGLTVEVPATGACIGPVPVPPPPPAVAPGCPLLLPNGAGAGEILLAPDIPGIDAIAPYVVSADPADGSDIDVKANPRKPIVLCFSELMQTDNAFTRAVLATVDFKGLPIPAGGGVSAADALVATSNVFTQGGPACPGGGTVLTLTPLNDLQPGLTYGVFVGGSAAIGPVAGLADKAGNACCRDFSLNALGSATANGVGVGKVFGEVAATPNTLLFTTNGGGGVLAGPATVSLGANSADFTGSSATITWTAVAGARAYEVYMSIAGGDFQLIARTAPGNDPVKKLAASGWDFNAALNGKAGVNPGVANGYDGVTRNVLESTITDVGDDVTPLPAKVDVADKLADLSDGFAAVRIAIGTVNTNGIVGSLSSAVVVQDNSGPTTNISTADAGKGVKALAAADIANGIPGATAGRGQLLEDRYDATGKFVAKGTAGVTNGDGVPDTILLGFSEPLESTSATTVANYQLKQFDGTTPARLTNIKITAAILDEPTDANGVFHALKATEDLDLSGARDLGNNVDASGETTLIKGNDFGHAYVTLLIAPTTPGGSIDIRDGDFVDITGVKDLSTFNGGTGNVNRFVDPSKPENQLGDITLPRLQPVATTDITAGKIVINFTEPLASFTKAANLASFVVAGVDCLPAITVTPAFKPTIDQSVTLQVDSSAATGIPACDVSRLAGDGTKASDRITFAAVTDAAANANPLDTNFNALLFDSATGTFKVVKASDLATLPNAKAPQLIGVAKGDNTGTNIDSLTLTFSQRLFAFTEANVRLRVNLVICPTARVSVNNQATAATEAFLTGDKVVTLFIDVPNNAGCNLANVITGDFLALGAPTTAVAATGIAGPPVAGVTPTIAIDDTADHAVVVGGNFITPASTP